MAPQLRSLLCFRVLRAVSSNWKTLLQTALLVVLVLVVFAAVGTARFRGDFAVGEAAGAIRDESDGDFGGCNNLGEVRSVDEICV